MKKLFVSLIAASLVGLTAAAANAIPTKRLKIATTDGTNTALTWREYKTSFTDEGIHTYIGYDGKHRRATVSLDNTGEISGWLYGTDGSATQVLAPVDCTLAPTGVTVPPQRAVSAEGTSDIINGDPLIYNDDRIHIYRTAVLISNYWYKYSCNSSIDKAHVLWAQVEAELNQVLGKQCGVYFQVVNDDRLIITDESANIPGSTVGNTIISTAALTFDDLIGADAYDYGVIIANISDYNGLSYLCGAYQYARRGSSTAVATPQTIAHEAVHMFGSQHTNADDNYSTYKSEPGSGSSIMASYSYYNWISLMSLNRIRRYSANGDMSYYLYPDRTTLIPGANNVPSKSSYNNYVWAIPSENHPPRINRESIKAEYTIPHGSYFQFTIDATDDDDDEIEYAAQQVAFYSTSKAVFRCLEPQTSPTVKFEPKWEYSYADRKWSPLEYTDVDVTGTYTFWVAVNDVSPEPDNFIEYPHAVGYDIVETKVNFVEGTPFKITNSKKTSYTAGQRLTLNWNVDTNIFDSDSKVRILLSDDFGESYKYVLKESAPNNGSCQVILPPDITIDRVTYGDTPARVRAGVIKVEVIGSIVYDVTEANPVDGDYNGNYYAAGGFTLTTSPITFKDTPDERYLTVDSEDQVPEKADVKAYSGATQLEVSYTETRDGNVISRVWEASDSKGNTSAYEQIIVIDSKPQSAVRDIIPEYVGADDTDDATTRYYDLQGRTIAMPTAPGIYVQRRGSRTSKIVIK